MTAKAYHDETLPGDALQEGLREKAEEFRGKGGELYVTRGG